MLTSYLNDLVNIFPSHDQVVFIGACFMVHRLRNLGFVLWQESIEEFEIDRGMTQSDFCFKIILAMY